MRFMLSAMRHVIGSLFVVLSSLALRGCGEDQASMVEMTFGTTEWAWPTEERATDYIPDYEVRVPRAAVDCKVKLFGFSGQITDGGEAAYFEVTDDVQSKVACLKRRLPEGTFAKLENAEWEQILKNRREYPHFWRHQGTLSAPLLALLDSSGWIFRANLRKSRHSQNHPFAIMSRGDPRSRKRHGGFAPLAKNSCRSASDPIIDIARISIVWPCEREL